MLREIEMRRSIRRFRKEKVPKAQVETILRAGMLAPSAKNRQPWRFVVIGGQEKAEMLRVMERGLEREKHAPLLPASAAYRPGALRTMESMRQADVMIAVVNPLAQPLEKPLSPEERVFELCNAQSIGAAMENMSLAAASLRLGSLWIADTFFAQAELSAWLGGEGVLTAMLAIGVADEKPPARPRKREEDVIQWRV